MYKNLNSLNTNIASLHTSVITKLHPMHSKKRMLQRWDAVGGRTDRIGS